MVNSAIKDSWRFLLLGIVLIVGYSAAVEVLLRSGFHEDYEESFTSFPRAIETLFYAYLGDFDVEVRPHQLPLRSLDVASAVSIQMFRSSSSFLAIWTTLLFASFIHGRRPSCSSRRNDASLFSHTRRGESHRTGRR